MFTELYNSLNERINIIIEIYHNLKLVTSHKRDDTHFGYTEKPSHNLPTRPSDYTSRLETLYAQVRGIDSSVEEYIKLVAKHRQYPERAYKSCKGIIETLGNKYGRNRLVEVCRLALELNAYMETIDYTLRRNLDRNQLERLASLDFIKEVGNILITGCSGIGKSYITML